jgi:ESCRT-II complex subunit VPS22
MQESNSKFKLSSSRTPIMSRRKLGLSSLSREADSASYSTLSESISSAQTSILASQLSTFQQTLSQSSSLHRTKILSSPTFRSHFSQLCAELGVDPLGGGEKGIWDKMGVGDWYYKLGIQVVDVCLRGRERGGGLLGLDEVIREVEILRKGGQRDRFKGDDNENGITESDVRRAIDTLEPLGCGYALVEMGGVKLVRCSPGVLDKDSIIVVEAASSTQRGAVTSQEVWEFTRRPSSRSVNGNSGNWSFDRVERALEKSLMEDGTVWIDEQATVDGEDGVGKEYWVPALFDFAT